MQRLDFAPLSRTLENHGLLRMNLVLEAFRTLIQLSIYQWVTDYWPAGDFLRATGDKPVGDDML
jgi:hypothetical protein